MNSLDAEVLTSPGNISHKKAVEKAKIGYKKYHKHTTIMNCYYEVVSYT